MSFNTSNLYADTISANIHYVEGIPLSNNSGNLKLGDNNNSVVECLELQANAQLSTPLATITGLSIDNMVPYSGVGGSITLNGSLNFNNYGITGASSLYTSTDINTPRVNFVNGNNAPYLFGAGNEIWCSSVLNVSNTIQTNEGLSLYPIGGNAVFEGNVSENYIKSYTGAELSGWGSISGDTIKNTNNSFNVDASGNVNANNIYCNKLLSTYQSIYIYYVSPNGDDVNGSGSINNPYQTIQKAVDVATALTIADNTYRFVMVQAGSYNENLNITSKINIIGLGTSPFSSSVGCEIGGSININVSQNGSDMFNNCVNISGFLIGSLVSFNSSANSILNIENCYLYSDDNTSGRALYFNPTSNNSRLRLTNTLIVSGGSQGTDPLVEITKESLVTINNVLMNSKGIQNVMMFSGTATCDTINNCKFVSDVNSALAPEIVAITSTNSGTYTFTNCGFLYGSSINKTSPSSSGIRSSTTAGNPRIVILYCSFFLLGTTIQQYAVLDANHSTNKQIICLYYMNGASPSNAFAINANNNQNKFQLQVVS